MRGYALPLDYFYRGNIEIKESYDDPDIGKERDIKAMLNKLKQFYYTDIMVQPDEDHSSTELTPEKVGCAHNTESENELSLAATVITEQLDEIVDRITSENSFTSKSDSRKVSSNTHSSKKSLHLNKRMSVTDIKGLLKNSCSRFASLEAIRSNRNFSFSKLDDGPQGKGSYIELNPIRNFFKNLTPDIGCYSDTSKTQDDILVATSKIISFINQKEKEYFSEVLR